MYEDLWAVAFLSDPGLQGCHSIMGHVWNNNSSLRQAL